MLTKPRRPETLAILVAVFLVAVLNVPFWRSLFGAVTPAAPADWLFFLSVFVVVFAVLNLILTIFAAPYVFKPAAAIILIVSAAASYFMGEYGVVIDRDMIRNVLQTNAAEARDLVTANMIVYVLALGVLPSLLLWRVPVEYRAPRSELLAKGRMALASIAVAAVAAMPFAMDYFSVARTHTTLIHRLTPLNIVRGTARLIEFSRKPVKLARYGDDASRPMLPRARKAVFVFVLGETARADHFSLNGYGRDTNPLLSKVPGLINYSRVFACGTDTAQSVPCMFSGMGRANYTSDIAHRQEGLFDILQRAGVSVLWRENQAGCKGTCERVETEILTGKQLPKFYDNGESYDEILLEGLEQRIAEFNSDAVIVLHMMGSHGPAYHKRYPKAFEHFTPVCRDSQFSRCEQEGIVNAYDNTIRYTDYVNAKLIELLQKMDRDGTATAMMYVSDHGESLGENNIYLHGMPYAIAPEAQKHVPMVAWLSPFFRSEFRIDTDCLAARSRNEHTHDDIFHSVLGLMDVKTKVYDKALDIFEPCRVAEHKAVDNAPANPPVKSR